MIDEKQYEKLLEKMREWVAVLARTGDDSKPLYMEGGGEEDGENTLWTPRTLLQQVEQRTPVGRDFLESWMDLAMQQILDAPPRSQSTR